MKPNPDKKARQEKMAKQILENVEFNNNLDWFHVETQIRREVAGLLGPFQEEM